MNFQRYTFFAVRVQVNSADSEGRTALHVATANNDIDAICRLVEWGADVNLVDKKKRTPLHFAAIGGHMDVCMLLLELAADLNAKDEKEYTAVAHAEVKVCTKIFILSFNYIGLQEPHL